MSEPRRMLLSLHRFEWCDLWDELVSQHGWTSVCERIVWECNRTPPNQETVTMQPYLATVLKILDAIPQSPLRIRIQHQAHVELLNGSTEPGKEHPESCS